VLILPPSPRPLPSAALPTLSPPSATRAAPSSGTALDWRWPVALRGDKGGARSQHRRIGLWLGRCVWLDACVEAGQLDRRRSQALPSYHPHRPPVPSSFSFPFPTPSSPPHHHLSPPLPSSPLLPLPHLFPIPPTSALPSH
jgi:hypothetical protein